MRLKSKHERNSPRFNKEFAKIKGMDRESAHNSGFLFALTLWASLLGLPNAFAAPSTPICADETTAAEEKQMVERINDRYDDFFRRQHEIEAEREMRGREAGEIKKVRAKIREEHENARREYVKNRPPKRKEDPKLEQEWLEQERAWKEQNKMARNCLVRSKDELKAIEKKGRQIPEMKEYDLDE